MGHHTNSNAVPISEGYKDFVIGQLEQIGPIRSKSMFGGIGLYAEEWFFGLMAEDSLYFKVDDSNRQDFEEANMGPFRPYGDDRAMSYYQVPIHVLEDLDVLRIWRDKAVLVAQNAKRSKRRKS